MNSTSRAKEKIGALSKGKARLLKLLVQQQSVKVQEIKPYPRGDRTGATRLPASRAQQRLWFIDQLESGGTAYHIPQLIRLRGRLDRTALQAALDGLLERHETLRTVFAKVDGEPVQEISPNGCLTLRLVDLAAHDPEEREEHVLGALREEMAVPFELSVGPLIRGRLLRLSEDEHVLLLVMHHIVSDGWSIGVLISELGALYAAGCSGEPHSLPPLPIQYADYARWQRQWLAGKELHSQVTYWKEHLGGAPELLELPMDRQRPVVQSYRGASLAVSLGPELTAGAKTLSRRLNVTLAMTLFAAWSVVLSRLGDQKDLVVGMPVANRQRTELEGLIGFFVNTLGVRVTLEDDASVAELLQSVKTILLGAYAHQDTPFEQVVEALQPARSLSHSPIFQVMFSMQPASRGELQLPGLTLIEQEVPPGNAHFDLTLSLQESTGDVVGNLNYASDLFDAATIQRWAEYFKRALAGMVADPQARVSQLQLLDTAERRQIIDVFNATCVAHPQGKLVHEMFEEQVEKTPQAVAVVFAGQSLTYAELNGKANQLAHHLRRHGVGPDRRVALCSERGLEMVVGMFAILKAGGAYVPLDPVHPAERLSLMIQDSEPVVVLTQPSLRDRLEVPAGCALEILDMAAWDDSAWAQAPASNLDAGEMSLTASHLAYVIYTSGSTGSPKGVMVEHANVLHFLQGMEERIYGTQPECGRVAWNSSFGFDMAAKAWGQLLRGRTVYLLPESIRLDAPALLAFLEQHRIEAIECTPSHLRMMQEAGLLRGRARSLRKILLGGEPIDTATWQLLAAAEDTSFFNMYGPTECSVDATCGKIDGETPNVGRVMPNARIYILDASRQPVPMGVAGEIHIGGAGVARGYLNRPELTDERFLVDPNGITPSARMYKTGDLGRWRADGTIEYLGRNDHQVKIRGFRIELGEIEAQLLRHVQVKEAVVVAREDGAGGKRLVAYVVPDNSSDTPTVPGADALRTHLQTTLPDYMVPSAFVIIERLPLTPNGKLDRQALPAPQLEAYASRKYEAPVGEAEEILAGIWRELLGVERVGRRDNFFELGGHSLLMMPMMDRLRTAGFGAELRRVFESPALADLAGALTKDAGAQFEVPPNLIPGGCTSITPDMLPLVQLDQEQIASIERSVPGGAANIQDIYPLAPLQEGILFHHLLDAQGGDTYVLSIVLSVCSRERVEQLITALQAVIDRHEILRTAVLWKHLPRAVQVVCRQAKLPVATFALDRDQDVMEQIHEWVRPERQRLPLDHAPQMRLQIASDIQTAQWYAVLQFHHITSDHVTLEIVMAEVAAHLDRRHVPLPESMPYRSHVAQALANVEARDEEAFFHAKLSSVDEPTAPFGMLNVHGDGTRIGEFREELEATLAQRVRTQARCLGVSAATLFHAAWGMVVARTSGRDDVVFGSVLLGRLQGNGGTRRTLGMFVNTLPLRLQLQNVSAKKLVEQTQRELAELLDHEQASLAVAQRCSGVAGSAPLFTTLLNYRHSIADSEGEWFSADGVRVLVGQERTNYPITLSVDDFGTGFALKAQTDRRIDPRRITSYLRTAVQRLVTALDEAPQAPVLTLSILPDSERRHIIESCNATAVDYPREKRIHHLFEEQAQRTPGATAVEYAQQSMTYAELNGKANQLARHLRAMGMGPGQLVGICVERSLEMVVGLLGILKAGAAYVPMDPIYPPERVQFMLDDAAPRVVLTQQKLQSALPPTQAQLFCLDTQFDALAEHSIENYSAQESSGESPDLVYVIYTSGSTGHPKGTMMPHGAMVNLVEWHRRTFTGNAGKRVLQFAALSFDVAFQETFTTLCTGGTLVLLDEWVRKDARALMQMLNDYSIHRLFVPPLVLQGLADHFSATGAAASSLEDVVTAGEQLRIGAEIAAFFRHMKGCRLHNHYGPTETHVVTALSLPEDPERWPALPSIGQPIANTQMYVLDAQGQPMPIDVAGEIYIGGASVASGYLGRPELTRQRFIDDPFSTRLGAKLYRTGDLGRWREDGNIEYLGRNDDQVKIRGFRIELGEVEVRLALHAHVKDAVVIVREDSPGDKRLVAYVTQRNQFCPAVEELRAYMKATLPDYMVPSAFVVLESLPVTPSGKVNRRALPAPEIDAYASEQYEAPEGEIEQQLAQIWQELLPVKRIGRHDNFFELGGHSLHGMKLVTRVEARFSVELSVAAVFQYPTIAQMASAVQSAQLEFYPVHAQHDVDVEVGTL